MATAFDNWLQTLAAAGKGGSALTVIDIPPAFRGEAWSIPVVIAGDWSADTLAAAIRATPDAASALATLTVTGGTYDSGTGYTSWTASLASGTGSNSTGSLPADMDGDGVEVFPIAFTLTSVSGTLFGGLFTLLGKV